MQYKSIQQIEPFDWLKIIVCTTVLFSANQKGEFALLVPFNKSSWKGNVCDTMLPLN